MARELGREANRLDLSFLDAPVSGGQAGAENGTLTVMCGGDEAAYARAEPAIAAYARACRLMGGAGAGQLTKMVNQLCIAGVAQGLAEGLHFAARAGLDRQLVVEVISQGAAQSWQMDNRHKTMIAGKFDFGFAVDWMRKDLAICLDEARLNGARTPVAAFVDRLCQRTGDGRRRWDTSSLIARLEGQAGPKPSLFPLLDFTAGRAARRACRTGLRRRRRVHVGRRLAHGTGGVRGAWMTGGAGSRTAAAASNR